MNRALIGIILLVGCQYQEPAKSIESYEVYSKGNCRVVCERDSRVVWLRTFVDLGRPELPERRHKTYAPEAFKLNKFIFLWQNSTISAGKSTPRIPLKQELLRESNIENEAALVKMMSDPLNRWIVSHEFDQAKLKSLSRFDSLVGATSETCLCRRPLYWSTNDTHGGDETIAESFGPAECQGSAL